MSFTLLGKVIVIENNSNFFEISFLMLVLEVLLLNK
jgi:hypothetical protein